MNGKNINHKLLIGVIVGVLVLIAIILLVVKITKSDKTKDKPKETIILKDNLTFEIGTELTLLSLISADNKVQIISEDEVLDTSTLGEKEITIKYKTTDKEEVKVFTIKIIDTTSPTIEYKKELTATIGTKIDLLKDIKVSDNSNEEITASVLGDYDINTKGTYNLKYVAIDSSGNKTEEEFTLKVNEKPKPNISQAPIEDAEFTTSKGFHGVTKNGKTYIDNILIVNKTYPIIYSHGNGLTSETSEAFKKMAAAATLEGLNIYISSGFRSYQTQQVLYNRYAANDGVANADTYSARPGHSEHQTGLAFDVNQINDSFAYTPEGKWLASNCYNYGFILRYPKGKTNETGYIYEPWHFRYVGTELATKLYNNGDWITLEDYFGITSEYSN